MLSCNINGESFCDDVGMIAAETILRADALTSGQIECLEDKLKELINSHARLLQCLTDTKQITAEQTVYTIFGLTDHPRYEAKFVEELPPGETEPPPVSPEKQKLLDELKAVQDELEPLINECLAAAREGTAVRSKTVKEASDLLTKKSQLETQLAGTP